jgi:hypothetical protein
MSYMGIVTDICVSCKQAHSGPVPSPISFHVGANSTQCRHWHRKQRDEQCAKN